MGTTCVHEVIRFKFDVLGDGEGNEYHRPVYRCEKCDQEFVPVWHLDRPADKASADE